MGTIWGPKRDFLLFRPVLQAFFPAPWRPCGPSPAAHGHRCSWWLMPGRVLTGWKLCVHPACLRSAALRKYAGDHGTEYVEAARSIGVSSLKIMLRHVLPNCIPSLIVLFTLNIPSAILSESSLGFLGLGIQKPMASWGLMVNAGRQYLYTNPWLSLAPSAAIMIIVLAFNFLGDGLRDVLDPHLKNQ